MKKEESYRPAHLEFDVATDGSLMPESFGEFENAEDNMRMSLHFATQ